MNMRTWGGQTDMLTASVHLMYRFLCAEAYIYIVLEHESCSRICYCTVKFFAPKSAFIPYSMDLPTEVVECQKTLYRDSRENVMFHIFTPVVEIF
jgi:hypothetical protein